MRVLKVQSYSAFILKRCIIPISYIQCFMYCFIYCFNYFLIYCPIYGLIFCCVLYCFIYHLIYCLIFCRVSYSAFSLFHFPNIFCIIFDTFSILCLELKSCLEFKPCFAISHACDNTAEGMDVNRATRHLIFELNYWTHNSIYLLMRFLLYF